MNRTINIIIFSLFLLVLSGCDNHSMTDLKQFVTEEKRGPKSPIDPIPAPEPRLGYVYSSSDSVDPFDVTNIGQQEFIEREDPRDSNRRKEDLEAFPLDSLRVVGTMSLKNETWGVVQAPDKTIHRVNVGRYIGENDGKVIAVDVDEQKITLVEEVQSATGEWVQREIFLLVTDE